MVPIALLQATSGDAGDRGASGLDDRNQPRADRSGERLSCGTSRSNTIVSSTISREDAAAEEVELGTAKLMYSLICDDVRLEVGNKVSLMGVFQNVFLATFPSAVVKFAVV